jgi:hypothetical protein
MRGFYILIGISIGFLSSVQSQIIEEKIKVKTLDNHQVSSFQYMESSFLNSTLHFELGLGESGVFTSDGLPVGDTTVLKLNSALSFIGLRFGYQQKIKEWIAFYINTDYGARLGTGLESVVTQGVNTILVADVGVKFKLLHNKRDALSGYIKMINTQATIIDVKRYVWELINNQKYARVKRDVPALGFGGGLAYTHVFSPLIGVNLDGRLVYGETLVRGQSEWLYFFGANLDLDFKNSFNVPISLVLGGYANTLLNAFSLEGQLTSTFTARVLYTGSRDFTFGIEFYNGQTPIENTSKRVKVEGFSFTSQFYF